MLIYLNPNNNQQAFPDVTHALKDPNGLLAVGGCLSVSRLENAYRHGIFPWYDETQPILWWSPDPRLILIPKRLKISKSLNKTLRKNVFRFSFDTCFEAVIQACAEPRNGSTGTWIVDEMQKAYSELHRLGHAHSFEAWSEDRLVGGLYGVSIGQVFFGESMFHRSPDASKAAFAFAVRQLQQWNYKLIDCQVQTDHLISLGAETIPRFQFTSLLEALRDQPVAYNAWKSPE